MGAAQSSAACGSDKLGRLVRTISNRRLPPGNRRVLALSAASAKAGPALGSWLSAGQLEATTGVLVGRVASVGRCFVQGSPVAGLRRGPEELAPRRGRSSSSLRKAGGQEGERGCTVARRPSRSVTAPREVGGVPPGGSRPQPNADRSLKRLTDSVGVMSPPGEIHAPGLDPRSGSGPALPILILDGATCQTTSMRIRCSHLVDSETASATWNRKVGER
jgi:hypothetical protein